MTEAEKQPRVLVVDDDRLYRELVEHVLSDVVGLQVDTADDGLPALDMLRETEYDLVVLDLVMPGLSGFDLLREIKKNWMETKVLIMSGTLNNKTKYDRCIEEGADGCIAKPIDFQDLIDSARNLLGKREGSLEGTSQSKEAPAKVRFTGPLSPPEE